MAIRTVFFIKDNKINQENLEIVWARGFAVSQKQKNITTLHEQIASKFNVDKEEILEVSTKSKIPVGIALSAINLKVNLNGKRYFFESVYQSSKVFDDGLLGTIHHPEWIELPSFEAKKESREVGLPLKHFNFLNKIYPLEPKTLFYDWLYIKTVYEIPNIYEKIKKYKYFTDIEFNPEKMISCQAKSLVKFKFLYENNLIDEFLKNPRRFYKDK